MPVRRHSGRRLAPALALALAAGLVAVLLPGAALAAAPVSPAGATRQAAPNPATGAA
ncbi:MAG: hypothetical protein QOF30_2102, partial [Acidimicrobiaceae bacterium]|nr:hypothetical protein [Acidimicrobiaceae bacterium]